jgi:sugar O-acyltransferase (sialic acid O-acetyltransferase NeuD family)
VLDISGGNSYTILAIIIISTSINYYNMCKPLILVGGGGHAKSCIDVIEEQGTFAIKGIIDVPEKVGTKVLSYEIVGIEKDIEELVKMNCSFLITVGQIKSAALRVKLWKILVASNAQLATIISPLAHVSKYAVVHAGSIVMHGAKINAAAVVGYNTIINTNAIIEHDTIVGNHCHISTGAIINGNCQIGNEVFIGSGTIFHQGINVTKRVKIGASSLIHKNIMEQGTYIGIPFKRIF